LIEPNYIEGPGGIYRPTGLIIPDDEWEPIVGPGGIDPNAIVEKPKPI
jgi:hypothetical protein